MLKSFFLNLSKRFYDENSLSDITWALANADHTFMKIFMAQFRFNFNIDELWKMYRESSENDSRPDLDSLLTTEHILILHNNTVLSVSLGRISLEF